MKQDFIEYLELCVREKKLSHAFLVETNNQEELLNKIYNLLKHENLVAKLKIENNTPTKETDDGYLNNQSSPEEKINLYLSLFKGRKDVYAKRWEKADGKSGYTPVCLNEWNKEFGYVPVSCGIT